MKKLLLLLVLMPVLGFSQTKKQKKAQEKADKEVLTALQHHVQYLADDKLEGRRTGSAGEKLASDYIQQQFLAIGLTPKGTAGYLQDFEINEGKQLDEKTNTLGINDHSAELKTDFFPLSYSPNKNVKSSTSPALPEKGEAWFFDLKESLEENTGNPHFDIYTAINAEIERAAKKGATALIVYNTSKIVDNVQFDKNDKAVISKLPVVFVTKTGFDKFLKDRTATYDVDMKIALQEKIRHGNNVIGYIDNGAPSTIIIGAHYDHLGFGEDKNSLDGEGQIHNGADDNASGTSAMIELARLLKKSNAKHNNYLFMAFSGEELGLLGSKYWLEHPSINVNTNYMINLDMVGRYSEDKKLTIGGFGTSPLWSSLVVPAASKNLVIKIDSAGSGPSDHASFYRKDVPVLFFFTNSHSDYHKATDDWDKINYQGELDIIKYIQQLITNTDTKGKLAFTKTREPEMGRSASFTVSLGVIPDYGFTGTGVRIDGVSKGKTAEKIGLLAGDILLQLGDYKFVDVQSYMTVLGKYKKGDVTKLRILRGTTEKEFDVSF
jgi:aminopeptidase YwaD